MRGVQRRGGTTLPLVVLLGLTVAACDDAKGGFGTPVQPSVGAFGGERQGVAGTVVVQDDGCVDLDLGADGLRWIVWPPDTGTRDGGATIVVGDHDVAEGDDISGVGAFVDASALSDWDRIDGAPWSAFGRFCDAGLHGVVVLDEATLTTR